MVEGTFIKKQNQATLTDSYNSFIQISIDFADINSKLQNSGEIGSIFLKVKNEQSRSLQAQEKIEQLIRSLESQVNSLLHAFGDAARTMIKILNGVLGIERNVNYDSISNFGTIQGRSNEKFISQITETNSSLVAALNLVRELEGIDSSNISIDLETDSGK